MFKKEKQKSYRVSKEIDDEIRKASEFFGCSDQTIIDVAVVNFTSLSRENQMKLIARYHLVMSRYLGLDQGELSADNILQLFGAYV